MWKHFGETIADLVTKHTQGTEDSPTPVGGFQRLDPVNLRIQRRLTWNWKNSRPNMNSVKTRKLFGGRT